MLVAHTARPLLLMTQMELPLSLMEASFSLKAQVNLSETTLTHGPDRASTLTHGAHSLTHGPDEGSPLTHGPGEASPLTHDTGEEAFPLTLGDNSLTNGTEEASPLTHGAHSLMAQIKLSLSLMA